MAKLQVPITKSLPEIKELYSKGGWMAVASFYGMNIPDIVSLLVVSGHLQEVKSVRRSVK